MFTKFDILISLSKSFIEIVEFSTVFFINKISVSFIEEQFEYFCCKTKE